MTRGRVSCWERGKGRTEGEEKQEKQKLRGRESRGRKAEKGISKRRGISDKNQAEEEKNQAKEEAKDHSNCS